MYVCMREGRNTMLLMKSDYMRVWLDFGHKNVAHTMCIQQNILCKIVFGIDTLYTHIIISEEPVLSYSG